MKRSATFAARVHPTHAMTPLRIAIIVPVAHTANEDWTTYAHRYIPLLHAKHLAAAGHEVHLFFDGPARLLHGNFTLHVSPSRIPPLHGVVRGPHLIAAAARIAPDVVHLHNVLAAENIAAATLLRCPVFAEFHGGAPSSFLPRRALLRWASARLAGLFTPAREHLEPLFAAQALSRSLPTHQSPETSSRFHTPATHPASPNLRVLTVARCESPKDPRATIATFAILARTQNTSFTWACPGGQELAALRSQIDALPNLDFGPRALTAMPEAYAAADVTVITSEREIGATVVSESLSQGTPVAAFELPAIRALGAGTDAVRIVPNRDPEALARAARELAAVPGIRERARRHYEEKLSFESIARDRARVYQTAVTAWCRGSGRRS